MFQTKVVQEVKIHVLYSVTVFRKSCRLWVNVEKYCRAGQATCDNMAHAHCMRQRLQIHTLGLCNTHCFFHCNIGCTNAPQCHVTHTFFFFFFSSTTVWVLACSIISFHCFLSCTFCFQFFSPILPHIILPSSEHSMCLSIYFLSYSLVLALFVYYFPVRLSIIERF